MGRVTIVDVARAAGVSTTTVSHVINGTRYVSDETYARVVKAMAELNYRPNTLARGLRRQSSRTIGLVVSDASNPFFTAVARGCEDVCHELGYNLILCNTDEDEQKEERYLHVLWQHLVDGIVIAPAPGGHRVLRELIGQGLPVVFIDRYVDDLAVHAVTVENFESSYRAVRRLILAGHRRIGLVSGLTGISSTRERTEGYLQALRDAGIQLDPQLMVSGLSRVEGGRQAARGLLSLPNRPTALFTTNNLMTIGAMQAIHELGLRCPEDVAVFGFDDFEWATAFRPALSTVAQPTYELGREAALMLFELLRIRKSRARRNHQLLNAGEPHPSQLISTDDRPSRRSEAQGTEEPYRLVLPVRLKARESCGTSKLGDQEEVIPSAPRRVMFQVGQS